jgi:hypothetical protein
VPVAALVKPTMTPKGVEHSERANFDASDLE